MKRNERIDARYAGISVTDEVKQVRGGLQQKL